MTFLLFARNDGVPEFLSPQPGDQAEVLEEARAGTAVYHAGVQSVEKNTANFKLQLRHIK